MSVKVIHKSCGAQIGWYLRDNISSGDKLRSGDYMRIDGTQPAYGEKFNEKCPSCGKKIQGAHEMVRVLNDDYLIKLLVSYNEKIKVSEAVPGWEKLVVTDRFKNWLGRQPYNVAILAESEFSHEAIALINMYNDYATELEASGLYQWAKRKTAASR